MKKNIKKLYFMFVMAIAFQLPAHAYLDPGTGSLIIQILIATFAGVAYWVKIQWQNIKGFIKRICTKKK